MALFSLASVTKRFGANVALDALSVSGEAGERLALVGPNGSGKSTLLRLLAGLLTPDAGDVRVLGGRPDRSGAARAGIGLAAGDDRSLCLRLSPRENLRFFGTLAGLRGRALLDGIERIAEELGFSPLLDRPAYELSSGNRARLLLARALVHRPALVLLDESSHALDQDGREKLHALLARRTGEGACTIVATHDPWEAERLATRQVSLAHGRLAAADASPAEGAA
ncbi:MAG: ATP-binding cassette domain-containing protein [Deltaproteobacteria bacterium]